MKKRAEMDSDKYIGFKDRKSKVLFLKYALPCSENEEELLKTIEKDREPEENLEDSFSMAVNMLRITANEKNKEKIDEETIREYFWFKHAEILKENNPEKKKEEISECLVLPGKIIDEKKGKNRTKVKLINSERREVNSKLLDKGNEGSWVVIHRDYASEGINEEDKEEIRKFLEGLDLI